jgi:hypothetical protein
MGHGVGEFMVNLYDTLAHLGIVLYRDMEMTIPVDDI